jgi:hemoglobin
MMMKIGSAFALVMLLAACSAMQMFSASKHEDGEVPLPKNYKDWPKFLSAVQRPDVKQVREIYVNPTGGKTQPGQPFANGTMFVMENYAAELHGDGNPAQGPDGKLLKGNLMRVFVMSKNEGNGTKVAPELKNGDWAYTSYDAAGNKTVDPLNACRACHLPLASKDYVQRYDEYFATRSK